ncbi:hypothetical protein XENTR_v10019668 [Xenopus tropicalis]|nr:hypothetical protein XENTR_v10019668 [Xenopus tropicalis]
MEHVFLVFCMFIVAAGGEGPHGLAAGGDSYHCSGAFITLNLENQTLIIKKNDAIFCTIEFPTKLPQTVPCEGHSQAYLANWTCLYLRNFQGPNDTFLLEYGRPQEPGKIAFLNLIECRNAPWENGTLGLIRRVPEQTRNHYCLIAALIPGGMFVFGALAYLSRKMRICPRCPFRQQRSNP